jgi:anaerobic magnesium-protoporphyrin IX monomethyl ester cyclase
MKVILINSTSGIIKSMSKARRMMSLILPPAGIAYIGAVLEKNGIEVKVIDQIGSNLDTCEVIKIIEQESPEIVGFSCLIHNIGMIKETVKKIRKLDNKIKIVLGNIYAAFFTDELLKDGTGDIVVRGEGEYAMLEISLALERGAGLQDIKGVSFIRNDVIQHNPERENIEHLDEIPYPAWHLFDLKYYRNMPLVFLNDIALTVQASRGCSYHCIFCSQDKTHKRPRYRKVKNVVEEIKYMHDKFKVDNFIFTDAYFPFSEEYGLEFCDEFIRQGLHMKIRWYIETRVDKVTLKLLKKMKEAGLCLILYGFEAGNQRVLDSLNKGTTLEQARKAMKNTQKAKIFTHGLFILGMPGETKETCEETIKFARELNPDIAKFNIAMPFPGSKFYDDYKDKLGDILQKPGKLNSWYNWASYSDKLVFTPEGMSGRDLINLQRKASLLFYMRPRLIMKHMVKRVIPFRNLFSGGFLLLADYFKSVYDKFTLKYKFLRDGIAK